MSFLSRIHPLDLTVILLFLVANMIVGFWSRGGRQTFTEYAVGDKKFSTPVLTATIVATCMATGVFFVVLENTYTKGLYYIIATVVGLVGSFLLTGLVVGARMGKFLNRVSVPDILGSYYGSSVQAISGISVTLYTMAYLGIQFKMVSKITEILTGHEGPGITIMMATFVILYSASGGVKSVTFTDVVQFFTFGSLIPLLALAVWNRMEAPPMQVTAMLDSDLLFSFREVVQWTPDFRASLVLMFYAMIPALPSGLFQRMAMARNVKQIRDSFIWATVLCLAIFLCMMWMAVLLRAAQPDIEKEKLVSYLVNTYTYPGLKGLVGVGVMALAMSTIDSTLNSTAVVITHDILPRLMLYKPSVRTAKAATFVLGFASLWFTFQLQDLLNAILLSASLYAPIIVVPALLTIFGFKTSRRVVLMAMGAGAVTVVSFLLYSRDVNSFFPGMLANLAVMLGAHYLLGEKGGWGYNPLPKTDFIQIED